MFTFIHITDLHISKFVYPDIKDDLQEFFSTTLDTIQPQVVLASGDLTDAKDSDGVGSFQIAEEWRSYRDLLVRNNVMKKTVYLDIRGNHDSFDVQSLDDSGNMFAKYSGQVSYCALIGQVILTLSSHWPGRQTQVLLQQDCAACQHHHLLRGSGRHPGPWTKESVQLSWLPARTETRGVGKTEERGRAEQ